MQSPFIPIQAVNFDPSFSREILSKEQELHQSKPIDFQAAFTGCMEMYSDVKSVGEYLNNHQSWFVDCAQPMKVESLRDNGYVLTIGRFGSFGYEVEPKIAVILEEPENNIYNTKTIPVPGEKISSYEVDYKAQMELIEVPLAQGSKGIKDAYKKHKISELPTVITQVKWNLSLKVSVQFPKFIYKLPLGLIQNTGDKVLAEIIRQVSPRLTYKVQQDFHNKYNLPLPSKHGRKFNKVDNG